MKQRAFRQNPTVGTPSKKARLRRRGQTAMSMYYTMQANFIALLNLPGWSMTCRANFVVFCGLLYALKIISKNISKGGV